jgi:hypothetical protein
MEFTKLWLVTNRDGTRSVVKTYSSSTQVFNADYTPAKEITQEEAKLLTDKGTQAKKRGRPRKDKNNDA